MHGMNPCVTRVWLVIWTQRYSAQNISFLDDLLMDKKVLCLDRTKIFNIEDKSYYQLNYGVLLELTKS